MRRAGGLFAEIRSFPNLLLAAERAARGKRHRPDVGRFFLDLEGELLALQAELDGGRYRPRPYRCFRILDPKERLICAAPFRDRVLQHAVFACVEPVFERGFIHDSYACRPGRGCLRALRRAQHYARRHRFFQKLDVRRFFPSVDHAALKGLIARRIKDRPLLALLDRIIDHPAPGLERGKGLPIGNLSSQHFANLYLDPADHLVKESLRVPGYVRYMDDMLLFADDKVFLWRCLEELEHFLAARLHLQLKRKSLRLAPVTEGIPSLGHRVFPGVLRVQRTNWKRFKRRYKRRVEEYVTGEISEDRFLDSARSLLGHLRHGDTRNLRGAFLASL